MKFCCFCLIILVGGAVFSQNSALINDIRKLQVSGDTLCFDGSFESEISWRRSKKTAVDNNMFFTALTSYTLLSLKPFLTTTTIVIDSLVEEAASSFQYYQNRNGGDTYNFYPVRPENPFPNVPVLANRKSARLPDDLDCSSFAYMVMNPSEEKKKALKVKMEAQSVNYGFYGMIAPIQK